MKKKWRRKNFFINKELQGKYVFVFFSFMLAGAVLLMLVFGLLSADTLTIEYKDSSIHVGQTPLVLFKEMLKAYWIFLFAGGFLVAVYTVFLTHRFAGPAFRFERTLEEMINGDFSLDVRVRRKDELKGIEVMINRLNRMLSKNMGEMKGLAADVEEALSGLSSEARHPKAAEGLERASASNKRLIEILNGFKLRDAE